jgi:hypothetical protein
MRFGDEVVLCSPQAPYRPYRPIDLANEEIMEAESHIPMIGCYAQDMCIDTDTSAVRSMHTTATSPLAGDRGVPCSVAPFPWPVVDQWSCTCKLSSWVG